MQSFNADGKRQLLWKKTEIPKSLPLWTTTDLHNCGKKLVKQK